MTVRQCGETGIKLIGVYFGVSALGGLVRLAALLFVPQMEGMPTARQMAGANALSVVGVLLVAVVCLLWSDALADRIFPESEVGFSALSRQDILIVGLALVGVSTALEGLPGIVKFAGTVIWYLEGSRQPMMASALGSSWAPLLDSTLAVVIGAAMAMSARRVASALDTGDPDQEHPR